MSGTESELVLAQDSSRGCLLSSLLDQRRSHGHSVQQVSHAVVLVPRVQRCLRSRKDRDRSPGVKNKKLKQIIIIITIYAE